MTTLSDKTAIVVGTSRGLGRGIAEALGQTGAHVVGVARNEKVLEQLAAQLGDRLTSEVADAADPTVAARLIDRYGPDIVVLVAGASPHMRPLCQQTWESFSIHWHSDVRIVFNWVREALLKPLRPASRVVIFSSGAILNPNGSPLSGGYAGGKVTQRYIAHYAQEESQRSGLDITFTTILPQFAPQTGVGVPAVAAYAAQAGLSVEDFLRQLPYQSLTPQVAGDRIVELLQADPTAISPSYLLNGGGLQELP